MKNVYIIEKATGKVIANIPIEMTAVHYTPGKEEYEAAAWEAAVDDGWVDRNRVSDYAFKIEDGTTSGLPPPPRNDGSVS